MIMSQTELLPIGPLLRRTLVRLVILFDILQHSLSEFCSFQSLQIPLAEFLKVVTPALPLYKGGWRSFRINENPKGDLQTTTEL